jgi:threonine dehydratase
VIYVPQGNSVEKNRAMRAFGAELVEHGEDFQAAAEEAARHAQFAGPPHGAVVPSRLVLGVATYALELLRAAPDLDVLYVPIGQGSGICGCIMARDLLGRRTEIVGVQSTEAPSYALSFRGRHGRDHRDQQHAGRRHGHPRSRSRGARDHSQGRLAHRAGHGR